MRSRGPYKPTPDFGACVRGRFASRSFVPFFHLSLSLSLSPLLSSHIRVNFNAFSCSFSPFLLSYRVPLLLLPSLIWHNFSYRFPPLSPPLPFNFMYLILFLLIYTFPTTLLITNSPFPCTRTRTRIIPFPRSFAPPFFFTNCKIIFVARANATTTTTNNIQQIILLYFSLSLSPLFFEITTWYYLTCNKK